MSDGSEINNLIEKDSPSIDDFPQYTNKQLNYIDDVNQGSYSSGQVRFEPSSMKTSWITLADAYLLLPIKVEAGGGTALATTSLIAVKQSVLSFIGSVALYANNKEIFNEENVNIVNNLKLAMNYSLEWEKEFGAELHASLDRCIQATNAAGNTSIVNDVTKNSGFNERVQYFKQSSKFAAAAFTTVVKIPLRYLHDLFAKMDFPLINFDWKILLGLNMYQNQSFAPMVKDIAATATTALTVTISPATIPGSNVTLDKVRLYYNTVEFDGSMSAKLSNKLKSGFTKKVYFTQTDTYLPSASETAQTVNGFTRTLSSSIQHPLRVWCMGVPNKALTGSGDTGVDTGLCTPIASFSNVNCRINGKLYYNSGLDNPSEIWDVLSSQFPSSSSSSTKRGGSINYSQFLSGQRYTLIDVSRPHDALTHPDASVEIIVSATRDGSNAASCDYYFIVERLGCVTFQINDQRASVLVGLNQ